MLFFFSFFVVISLSLSSVLSPFKISSLIQVSFGTLEDAQHCRLRQRKEKGLRIAGTSLRHPGDVGGHLYFRIPKATLSTRRYSFFHFCCPLYRPLHAPFVYRLLAFRLLVLSVAPCSTPRYILFNSCIVGDLVFEGGKKTQTCHVFLFNEVVLCTKLQKKVFGDRKQKQLKVLTPPSLPLLFLLFCFVLFCFVLFCFVLFCFVLFCFVLFCFVLLFCFVVLFCCLFCFL